MRNYLFALTIVCSLSLSAQELQLSWQKDFTEATEMAKAENKFVLIYFTKADCAACQQFYLDFFKQEDFEKLSNKFVFLLLDASNADTKTNDIALMKQRRLIGHYNKVSQFPAVRVLDSNHKEIGELFTSKDTADIATYWSFLETL